MKPEIIIAITATVISLCAFFFAVWQGYTVRKHYRLSVRPILNFDWCISDGDFMLKLKNTGVGPAIISTCMITFNNKEIGRNLDEISLNLREELELGHFDGKMYLPGVEQAMAAGEEYRIFQVIGAANDEKIRERLKNDILWLKVDVKYNSIYGEQFSVFGPDFSW